MNTTTNPTITATGISGTTHTFTRYPLNTSFTAVGGVYLILKQDNLLYVGQTGDLSARFNDHHKEACWTRHGADGMAVIGVSLERDRLRIEKDLIDNYDPPCNG
jgi:excinuclease UvrABC nuclease subunit